MSFFGEFSWPVFVQVLPVYIAAVGAIALLWATFVQIKTAKEDAMTRAAFDYYSREADDVNIVKLSRETAMYCLAVPDASLYLDDPAQYKSQIDTINQFLDRRENLAVGILNGGVSEEYSKIFIGSLFLEQWKHLEGYIRKSRKICEDDEMCSAIEELALRWLGEN